jgi:hypothetical protein
MRGFEQRPAGQTAMATAEEALKTNRGEPLNARFYRL